MNPTIPSRLTDRDLVAAVARLAESERDATAALIAHLAELYARRLHERAGFSSLFTYCMEVLHLSEHEAYDRMKAAKVARRYPAVLGLLASGRVNLTTIRLLAPHLSRTNHEELFAAASGKRKRQVQELLAQRFPKPDVPSSVRKLPARNAAPVAPVLCRRPRAHRQVRALHSWRRRQVHRSHRRGNWFVPSLRTATRSPSRRRRQYARSSRSRRTCFDMPSRMETPRTSSSGRSTR